MNKIKRLISSVEFSVFVIAALIIALMKQQLFTDPDVAWHIAAGRLILAQHAIPSVDTWSFFSDQQWYLISWLWDVLVAIIDWGYGLQGIYFVRNISFGLVVACIVMYLHRLKNVDFEAVLASVVVIAFLIIEVSSFRPQLHSYLLAILLLHMLDQMKISLIKTAILFVVWANIHGSFLIGFIVIGCYGLAALIKHDLARFRELFFVGIVALISTLFNPLGYNLYTAILRTMDSVITASIYEWQPYLFGQSYGMTFFAILSVLLLRFDGDVKLEYRIMYYVLFSASLISIRNFGFCAIFAAPYLARALTIFMRNCKKKRQSYVLSALQRSMMNSVLAFVLIFVTFFIKDESLVADSPTDAILWVIRHCNHGNIINDYNIGGYVPYYDTASRFKHLIDGRAGTAFSEERLTEYLELFKEQELLDRVIQGNNVRIAIFANRYLELKVLDNSLKNWENVYNDKAYSVFMKEGACEIIH